MIKLVLLLRRPSGNHGTFGRLFTSGFQCVVGEPPWHNNAADISCILEGVYLCEVIKSRRFGRVYTIWDVPDRDLIRIHSGNLVGDTALGYLTHSLGCLVLGKYFGWLGGQRAVLYSRPTLRKFMVHMEYKPFELHVVNRF